MEKYISIGEMAKLSGVSIRSLRYYDEIGILKPIYINFETNYRYYTIEQFPTLSAIQACIQLNIPLKNLDLYKNKDKSFDILKLVHSGEEIAYKKIEEIKNVLIKLNSISNIINLTESLKERINPYTRNIKKRYFLVMNFNKDFFDDYDYTKAISELYKKVDKIDTISLFYQGLIKRINKGKIETFVFLEIYDNKKNLENIIEIEEGIYDCSFYTLKELEKNQNIDNFLSEDILIFYVDIFDNSLETHRSFIEIQKIPKIKIRTTF